MSTRSDTRECAKCAGEGSLRCAGCMDSPDYHAGDSVDVAYCGKDCQKDHWSTHKAQCIGMQRRKKLLRAAILLKTVFLTYRDCFFDVDLTKIEFRDGILYLHQKLHHATSRGYRGPFPAHITTDNEHKEAALANNQCTASMAILSRLTWKALAGLTSTVELMDIRIGKPLVPTRLTPLEGLPGDAPHTVLKVRQLRSNEDWILDPAGCQYGFRVALAPFQKYLDDHKCQIISPPTHYDWTETEDLDYYSSILPYTSAQRRDHEVDRMARLHHAAFVDECFGNGNSMIRRLLNGTMTQFQDELDDVVRRLREHMKEFVETKLPRLKA
ncbi:hypothetical protein SLS62_009252 [Diatrype stigma]|uniref:MYND-type domain-containing protein n=1 Tax=Diatrype stigma TaxID=117547 RepID=A0AAN9YK68_9PEZI